MEWRDRIDQTSELFDIQPFGDIIKMVLCFRIKTMRKKALRLKVRTGQLLHQKSDSAFLILRHTDPLVNIAGDHSVKLSELQDLAPFLIQIDLFADRLSAFCAEIPHITFIS